MAIKHTAFIFTAFCVSVLLFGCTRQDPYTGQTQVDYGATAGVAGLALGATALGVAASNNNRNDRDVVVVNPRPPAYRPYQRPPYHGGRPPAYRPGYRPGYGHGHGHGHGYGHHRPNYRR